MWTKILKVLMYVYLIASLFVAIYAGKNAESFLVGCITLLLLIMLGSMMGVVSEIGSNTAKISKDIAVVKRYYLAQLGVYENQTYANTAQQDVRTQYSNTQYLNNQYTDSQYAATQQFTDGRQAVQNQDNNVH